MYLKQTDSSSLVGSSTLTELLATGRCECAAEQRASHRKLASEPALPVLCTVVQETGRESSQDRKYAGSDLLLMKRFGEH